MFEAEVEQRDGGLADEFGRLLQPDSPPVLMDGRFHERPRQESGSVQRCLRARVKERNSQHEEHLSSERVGRLETTERELQFVHEWKSEHRAHRRSSVGVSMTKRVPRQTRREGIDHQGVGKRIQGKCTEGSVRTRSPPRRQA